MRVLIFHGYLLRGTGSNIYNASLARALAALGHDVHLLCQDRAAAELDWVGAIGRWEGGELLVEPLREGPRVTVYTPEIGRTLPVYVADEYEGFDAVPFGELSHAAIEHYVEANAAAVREVAAVRPDVALANHLVMGPAILARGLEGKVPYAVKVHGSALEYTVRPARERFLPYVLEGLRPAAGVLVGSAHTARSLWEVVGDPALGERTRLGPPGVDLETFRPRDPAAAAAGITELADRLDADGPATWGGEAAAPAALRALDPRAGPLVGYVGKLIVSKGVDLLLAAWPLVVAREPAARLVIVGFGTLRDGLGELLAALGQGDLAAVRGLALRGRELEGGEPGELSYLLAFLDGLSERDRERYATAARRAAPRVHFTGRLEHGDLPLLLPALSAQVVPSTFPEAFGMVAAEAACCGALPVSAAHSGLAEVSAALAPALPRTLRPLLAFERGPRAVSDIAARLGDWLALAPPVRAAAMAALATEARRRFGWEAVAHGVIAAAEGRLGELERPGAAAPPSAGHSAPPRG